VLGTGPAELLSIVAGRPAVETGEGGCVAVAVAARVRNGGRWVSPIMRSDDVVDRTVAGRNIATIAALTLAVTAIKVAVAAAVISAIAVAEISGTVIPVIDADVPGQSGMMLVAGTAILGAVAAGLVAKAVRRISIGSVAIDVSVSTIAALVARVHEDVPQLLRLPALVAGKLDSGKFYAVSRRCHECNGRDGV